MTVHQLKSWPEFFEPVLSGQKQFELRRNDRDFQVGDHVLLREYEPEKERYTGREISKRVTYVMQGLGTVGVISPLKGLSMGYAIIGFTD